MGPFPGSGELLRPCQKGWPPSSSDLNLMDYFIRGYLESHTNRCPHTTKASLIASKKEHFASLTRDLVIKAYSRFRGRDRGWRRLHQVSLKMDNQENFCFLFEIKILKFRDFILFLLFLRDEVRALYNILIITNNPVGEDWSIFLVQLTIRKFQFLLKELSFCHKLKFLNLYIFAIW